MTISLGACVYLAVKPILKIYLIILIGYVTARYDILTVELSRGISRLVVNVLIPCLTFNKLIANLSHNDAKAMGVVVLSSILLMLTGASCALFVHLVAPVPKHWFWGLIVAGIFYNTTDLSIAYIQSMSGGLAFSAADVDKGVAYNCICMALTGFMLMNLGMFRIIGLDFKISTDLEKTCQDFQDDRQESLIEESCKSPSEILPTATESGNSSTPVKHDISGLDGSSDNSAEKLHCPHTEAVFQSGSNSLPSLDSERPTALQECTDSHTMGLHVIAYQGPQGCIHRVSSCCSGHSSRTLHSRGHPTKTNDVITEYSAVNRIRAGELDLSKPVSLTEEVASCNAALVVKPHNTQQTFQRPDQGRHNVFSSSEVDPSAYKLWFILKKSALYLQDLLVYVVVNFFRPVCIATILGLLFAMVPWLRALFVANDDIHIKLGPDRRPVLSLFMDATRYVGDACVPMGLLLIGSTLACLQFDEIPKGCIKSAILMSSLRLIVLPIIGLLLANKFYNIRWLNAPVEKFMIILTWSMPSATGQVFFTAFFTPPGGKHPQMDCLSVFILTQYIVLFFTLPIIIAYTLEVELRI